MTVTRVRGKAEPVQPSPLDLIILPDPEPAHEHRLLPGVNVTCGECVQKHGNKTIIGLLQRVAGGWAAYKYVAGHRNLINSYKLMGTKADHNDARALLFLYHKHGSVVSVAPRTRTRGAVAA